MVAQCKAVGWRRLWLALALVLAVGLTLAGPVAAGDGPGGGSGGKGNGGPDSDNTLKGDLFGDLWVLLRDANGVPVLSDAGCYQPVDATGTPITLDEECMPLDETLTQEVDLGRVNVARAPSRVLEARTAEAVALLNGALSIGRDPAGRVMYETADGWLTIDSPLENLGLYVLLMNTGGLGLDANGQAALAPGLEFLGDGQYGPNDMAFAAGLYAGATDKVGEISTDAVVYINTFLAVEGTITGPDNRRYVDYIDNVGPHWYDRAFTYDGVYVDALVQQPDGSWIPTPVNLYEWVFFSEPYADHDGGIDGWTRRADDARRVIEFLHEYAVPVDQTQPGSGT